MAATLAPASHGDDDQGNGDRAPAAPGSSAVPTAPPAAHNLALHSVSIAGTISGPDLSRPTAALVPQLPRAAAALFDLAAADPSLHAATLGKSAHLTLDAGSAGELMLHLRVRDGVADVRVDGAAAGAVDIRSDEIRTALAGEGLALGRFESAATPDSGRASTMPTDGQVSAARTGDPAIGPEIGPAVDRANATSGLPVSFAHDGARTTDAAPMGSDTTFRSGFGSGTDLGSQPRDPQARDPQDARDPAPRAPAPARPTPVRPGSPDDSPSQPRGSRGLHVTA